MMARVCYVLVVQVLLVTFLSSVLRLNWLVWGVGFGEVSALPAGLTAFFSFLALLVWLVIVSPGTEE